MRVRFAQRTVPDVELLVELRVGQGRLRFSRVVVAQSSWSSSRSSRSIRDSSELIVQECQRTFPHKVGRSRVVGTRLVGFHEPVPGARVDVKRDLVPGIANAGLLCPHHFQRFEVVVLREVTEVGSPGGSEIAFAGAVDRDDRANVFRSFLREAQGPVGTQREADDRDPVASHGGQLAQAIHRGQGNGFRLDRRACVHGNQHFRLGDGLGCRLVGIQIGGQRHVTCPCQAVANARENGRQAPPGVQHQHTGPGTARRYGEICAIVRRSNSKPLTHAHLRTYTEHPFAHTIAKAGRFVKQAPSPHLDTPEIAETSMSIDSSTLQSVSTPAHVETRLGSFDFPLGFPTDDSAARAYDQLDCHHAVDAYFNGLPAVSLYAVWKGFAEVGISDGDVLICSELMDASSIFLTANNDTIYFWTFVNLADGPLVLEPPPQTLGIVDDMWWNWVTDFGLPGPDRGLGGTYLLLPPGYHGPLPEGGMFVFQAKTNRLTIIGRRFLDNDDPAPGVAEIKDTLRIYPYVPGAYGSSVASFLQGKSGLAQLASLTAPRFVEGSKLPMNTVPPNDYSFWEMLNEAIQAEPAEALDPEIAEPIAAIGIVKDQPFEPDARIRGILTEAVAAENALARSVSYNPRKSEGFHYYPNSSSNWFSPLFAGGYDFTVPPPLVTKDGVKPFPNPNARKLNARASFFYVATGITPGNVHAPDRDRLAIPDCRARLLQRPARWRKELHPGSAAGHTGSAFLVGDRLRQPDAVARSPFISAQFCRRAWTTRTGSRPCRARGGS